MPLVSMTGFADLAGEADGLGWRLEARSVNGRGLDLRLRFPEGFETLEAPMRTALSAALSRGSVTVTLRIGRSSADSQPSQLDFAALAAAIEAALAVGEAASRRGLDLAPMTAADLLAIRGVFGSEVEEARDNAALLEAIADEARPLAQGLRSARAVEGAALEAIIGGQINRIAELAAAARAAAGRRGGRMEEQLRSRVDAVLAMAPVDEARMAQELAMIAVKADVSEELDRLDAHVRAARGLLGFDGPVGRKLDFLVQEFNREANTLCSKAGSAELTSIGLEMKVVIDQMREQVQNVE